MWGCARGGRRCGPRLSRLHYYMHIDQWSLVTRQHISVFYLLCICGMSEILRTCMQWIGLDRLGICMGQVSLVRTGMHASRQIPIHIHHVHLAIVIRVGAACAAQQCEEN
jgi:hypothetical protein